jgi:hypothetical protein
LPQVDAATDAATDAADDARPSGVPDAGVPDARVPDGREPDAAALDADVADAPVAPVAVTGEVSGMWDGASLVVVLQAGEAGDQRVTLDANGAFAFPELPAGTPFVAVVESSPALHSCTVRNQRGRAFQGTLPVQITCAGPALQIELSNPDGFAFDPMTRSYDLAYSFLTREQRLRVVGADALDVRLDGSSLALGSWAAIALGDDPVTSHVRVGVAGVSLSFELAFHGFARPIVQRAYAKAPFLGEFREFGARVAVSSDTLVASGGSFSGGATAFQRTGATWTARQFLQSPDGGSFGQADFGASVAVSGDTLVIGAPLDGRVVSRSGAVFVYRLGFSGWLLEAVLKASNADLDDDFGDSVAIDGDTIVVGARREDGGATGPGSSAPGPGDHSQPGSGAAYVFRRSGTSWTQEAYLKASNTGQNDGFGQSLAISGDTIAVGAEGEDSAATGVNGSSPGQDDNSMASAGAVYVFHRTGTDWAQEAYVKASNPGRFDSFGGSVALSADTLVVGAEGEDSAATGVDGVAPGPDDDSKLDSGAAYVFHRASGAWTQQAYLKASNTGAGDSFGASVAVWLDTVVVGAPFEDGGGRGIAPVSPGPGDDSKQDSGAVYVFRHGSTWRQELYVKSANSDAIDAFGFAVAIGPDTFVAGAVGEGSCDPHNDANNSCVGAGAVYVFR